MADSKVIFLVGYFGFGNVGDEAILSAMLTHFRGRSAGLHFIVASGNPDQTAAAHTVAAIRWNDIAAIHRTVQKADLVVIGGGGLFHDYWGTDPDALLSEHHWGVVYYAGPALLARVYRKPLMLFGVGVGPLYSEPGRKFTRLTASACHAITVRDAGSKRLLQEIGIPEAAIRVTADPGFLFDATGSATLAEAVPEGFELPRPVVGVAVRYWGIGVHPDFLERELAAALDLCLKQQGGTVVLIPFQDISGKQENDRATAERILGQMRLRERAVVAGEGSPSQIYGWISGCDAVIGMRLHAMIFAAMAGVPAVALQYDPKVQEVVSLLGLEDLSLDIKNIDALKVAALLDAALQRRDALGKAMREAAAELRQAAAKNISIAIDLLDMLPAEIGPRLERLDFFAAEQALKENQTLNLSLAALRLKNDALAAQLAETRSQAEATKQGFEASVADLDARRQEAEAERAGLGRNLDRFAAILQNDLTLYRGQRAWKVMLLIRKGYTLFRCSKWGFLGWALGLPFGRAGSLREYELPFPDIRAYVPETLRRTRSEGEPRRGGNGLAQPNALAADTAAAAAPAIPENPPQRDRYDVVILTIIDFDFRFQRPQQIAAEFARQGHRVFWISPTRFLPPASRDAYEVHPLREHAWEIHLRSRQPDIYLGELGAEEVESITEALQAFYREWGVAEHVVVVQLPFWRRVALKLRAQYGSKLLYDCMDDWETFENMGAFNLAEERELVRECDVLVVTGAELQKKFDGLGVDPVLVRNAADYPFFALAGPNDLLDGVPRPIVGYFGAIADWIDLDLVYEVAKRRPQYSFVLIGQVFDRDVSRLESLGNVRLAGNKPYAEIPSYLYGFDACLIPFLLNQVTKATDPVKLYEYLSLGKPVVATDMAELAQCGDLLYIGKDADDFAGKIDAALAEKDPERIRRRIDFARSNTWTRRVEQIDGAVREAFSLVSILIVTYNSARFVAPCLESILHHTSYPRYETILVDNASTDETAQILEEYAARDERFRVVRLPRNLGFAAGNNQAAQQARGEYLIFLNIDTMVTAGWVGRLLRHLHRDPSIGLLCPVTNFAGNEVKINVSYGSSLEMEQFAGALAIARNGERIAIQVAPLYCALLPRRVWEQVGELDTRYEIGMFEDDDFSVRVRQAGFGVFAAEDTFIHHFGQGSFSKLPGDAYNRIFEANRKRFEEKWKLSWVAHRTRPGVRPSYEEQRFEPAQFVVK